MSDKMSDKQEFLLKLFAQIQAKVNQAKSSDLQILEELAQKSYTSFLVALGCEEMGKKLLEEAFELSLAAISLKKYNQSKKQVIAEASDVIYHLMVLLADSNIKFEEVIDELEKRQNSVNSDQTEIGAKLIRKAKKNKKKT